MSQAIAERVAAVEVKAETNKAAIKTVTERLNTLQFWIMATFGGVTTAVLLLLVQFALNR